MIDPKAKEVFGVLCRALDAHEFHYQKNEEELTIECGAQGDDLPMEITMRVEAERHLILLLSHIPFVVAEDKRLEVAVAVSVINNRLVDGSFDFDIRDGHMFFRMTNSYLESKIGQDAFAYLLYCSCMTIDKYNDKLMLLAKGLISLEQFISSTKE